MNLLLAIRSVSCLLLLFFFALISNAQDSSGKDAGFVVYRLGTDTTVVQHFEYEDRKYKTTILTLSGQAVKYEGQGELDKSGDIKRVLSKTFRLDSMGNWLLVSEATNIYDGDSSIYTVTSKGKQLSRRAVPGNGIVSNAADACSFFVFPYMGFFAPAKTGDTLYHCHLVFGECRTFHVARLDNHELGIGSGVLGKIKLFLDDKNRMTGADAIGSSVNFIAAAEREKKDYKRFIDLLARKKITSGNLAPRTFRDTTRFVSRDKQIEIDYWRPYRRNRQIFGAVVPWNRIWRTGANNSTQFRTTANLNFNGTRLPAGKYSIWTFPTVTKWELIFNKKADVWGTEYDPIADIIKVPLTVEKTTVPVEIFRLSLQNLGNQKLRMLMEWEFYKAWVDFTIE